MMIKLTKAAEKDLKKSEHNIRQFLIQNLYKIAADPALGKSLKGTPKKYNSFHCSFTGIRYRIIYRIDTESKSIIVVMKNP